MANRELPGQESLEPFGILCSEFALQNSEENKIQLGFVGARTSSNI